MSGTVMPIVLPVAVFLVMVVIIGAIASMYFASGSYTGAIIVGVILTVLIGGVAAMMDRKPR